MEEIILFYESSTKLEELIPYNWPNSLTPGATQYLAEKSKQT